MTNIEIQKNNTNIPEKKGPFRIGGLISQKEKNVSDGLAELLFVAQDEYDEAYKNCKKAQEKLLEKHGNLLRLKIAINSRD